MRVTAHIRRNETRVVRLYEEDSDSDWSTIEYLWADGNFSCDCNRAQLFFEAMGLEDPNIGCGEDAYSVNLEVDGKIRYQEFP